MRLEVEKSGIGEHSEHEAISRIPTYETTSLTADNLERYTLSGTSLYVNIHSAQFTERPAKSIKIHA